MSVKPFSKAGFQAGLADHLREESRPLSLGLRQGVRELIRVGKLRGQSIDDEFL